MTLGRLGEACFRDATTDCTNMATLQVPLTSTLPGRNTYIRETSLSLELRLGKEFPELTQGGPYPGDFRALLESMLQDMVEAEVEPCTSQRLLRACLSELDGRYRTGARSTDWKLDGEGRPARQPRTYKEVAQAVGVFMDGESGCSSNDYRPRSCAHLGRTPVLRSVMSN